MQNFICKEKFEDKLRTIVIIHGQYRCATRSKCNLKYSLPEEIYTVFPTGSNYCHVSVVSFSYWSKVHVNIITASGVIKILVFKGLTRKPEIGNTFFCVLSNVWILEQVRYNNLGTNVLNEMLLNAAKFQVTAFIVSELLRENQQEVKWPLLHTYIQLTIAINFMSSKDNNEERVMHSESDNIEIMIKW